MARLYPHKRNNKKLASYLVLAIIALVFMLTVGIQILINAVFFILDLTSKPDTPEVRNQLDDNFFSKPEITNIPTATNSARISLQGTSSKNSTITVFVNNIDQKSFSAENGDFETKITLQKGENEVYIEAQDNDTDTTKQSAHHLITFLDTPPEVNISTPLDRQIVYDQEITIRGSTDKGVLIKINSSPVVVGSDGNFFYTSTLQSGENTFQVTAQDVAGNLTQKKLVVIYEAE